MLAELTAADGLVITMLSMIVVSFGIIGVLILSMRWNASRGDPHVEELLREIEEEEKHGKHASAPGEAGEKAKPSEPWEREADWWKE